MPIGVVDKKAAHRTDLNAFLTDEGVFDHLNALFEGEHWILGGVDGDGDDHFVEEVEGAIDDIDMAHGDRIEGAGIDRDGKLMLFVGGHWLVLLFRSVKKGDRVHFGQG